MNPHNYKHIETVCPECRNNDILHDPVDEVTYCTKCGFVLKENIIFRVTKAMQDDKIEEKRIRKLWLRKREKNLI